MDPFEQIDELISSGMEGFSPEPPADAWDAIQNSLNVSPASPSGKTNLSGHTARVSGKISSLLLKVGAVLIVPVSAGIIYFSSTGDSTGPVEKNNPAQVDPIAPSQNQVVQNNENSEGKLSKIQLPSGKSKAEVKISKPLADNPPAAEPITQAKPVERPSVYLEPAGPESNPGVASEKSPQQGYSVSLPKDADRHETPESGKKENQETPDSAPAKIQEIPEPEPVLYNVISPDGDGKNDKWEIEIDPVSYFNLQIYDMRGKVVFESNSPDIQWTGVNMKSGADCEPGQYYFILRYQLTKSNSPKIKQGKISLIR